MSDIYLQLTELEDTWEWLVDMGPWSVGGSGVTLKGVSHNKKKALEESDAQVRKYLNEKDQLCRNYKWNPLNGWSKNE